MDALSSSFLSNLPHSISTPSRLIPSDHVNLDTLTISAVRIDEKPPKPVSISTPKPYKTSAPPPSQSSSPKTLQTTASTIEKKRNMPTFLFNAFDDIINTFIDPPIRPSVDPKLVLSRNFAPVDELPPTPCEVKKGTLPSCLDGANIRNGPNPQFVPRGPHHLFDGDGMLHSILISKGKATYCSRYVKTYKYKTEREAGGSILPSVFSGFHGLTASAARGALSVARMLSGHFSPANGMGLANTSLAYFGNHIFALYESDLPYSVRIASNGDIETLGRHDFGGKLLTSMTAHPKIDTDTNEAFGFQFGHIPPFLTYFRFDADGKKQPGVPVFSMTTPSFVHDFAITKKYAVFPDIQIRMNPIEVLLGGSHVSTDSAKIPRIGIMPRYAKDESKMKWFDVPGFNIVHAINAWDEDEDEIVLIAPNILSIVNALEKMELIHASIEKVRIDLKTGNISRHPISTLNLELAVINPNYIGKKNRYVYAAIGDPMPKITGIVKLDVSKECTVARQMYGPGCYGGEPFFVARDEAKTEDDGYVVSFVHDENSGESEFLVMDAKSDDLEIIAAVKLPRRVPYGFHGLFVKESDLNLL